MRADSNDAYVKNQCSLVIRIDGDELEIPVTFGMSADEIRMLYPFLLPLVNDKIENPALQFSRAASNGMYADLTEEEYDAEMQRIVAQSKFWYEKPQAGLLDIAVRFALDIKLKGLSELSSIFGVTPVHKAIESKPLTKDEADRILQNLNIDPADVKVNTYDNLGKDTDTDEVERDEAKGSATKLFGKLFAFDNNDYSTFSDIIENGVTDTAEEETDDDVAGSKTLIILKERMENERKVRDADTEKKRKELEELTNNMEDDKYASKYDSQQSVDNHDFEFDENGVRINNSKNASELQLDDSNKDDTNDGLFEQDDVADSLYGEGGYNDSSDDFSDIDDNYNDVMPDEFNDFDALGNDDE